MLTISISISSGVEAVLSFLPPGFFQYKLTFILLITLGLILLNLRGVKESVATLTPIFLLFFVSHAALIVYGIFSHVSATPTLFVDTIRETRQGIAQLGFGAMAFILLRAYSLGAGTYTGIEAVSNGLQILRPPQVKTGKKTMVYMAASLAFTAGGLLVCYLLTNVQHVAGKTLNASLLETLIGTWKIGGFPLGVWLLGIILVSEGRHPLRRRADGLHRRPARPRQHGHRFLGAEPVHAPLGAPGRPERHPVHGPGLRSSSSSSPGARSRSSSSCTASTSSSPSRCPSWACASTG